MTDALLDVWAALLLLNVVGGSCGVSAAHMSWSVWMTGQREVVNSSQSFSCSSVRATGSVALCRTLGAELTRVSPLVWWEILSGCLLTWAEQVVEGKPLSAGRAGGMGRATSCVSGEVSVRLQSELVMGESVGEAEEGPPLASTTASDVGGGGLDFNCVFIGMILRLRGSMMLVVGGWSMVYEICEDSTMLQEVRVE